MSVGTVEYIELITVNDRLSDLETRLVVAEKTIQALGVRGGSPVNKG